ncbi:MAG: phosphotransferase [Candidatus Kerfeldbacteria bacterium]|nr:phosphotransferase [Candidatus Kerfeldbacteria bacterium]
MARPRAAYYDLEKFLLETARSNMTLDIQEILERDEVSQYSNNNYLWRMCVKTPRGEETIYVKHARGHNRRAWQKRGKYLATDPDRICGEYRLLTHLQHAWGRGYVPEIYYFGPTHCVLVMQDVSQNAHLLIEEFNRGRLHADLGTVFGKLFGELHSSTYGAQEDYCGSVKWRKRLTWLFETWFPHGMRKQTSSQEVRAFYTTVASATHSWIWGDAVHRNIFVRTERTRAWPRVSMVDFDHARTYDPALDNGMLLAHWAWMSVKSPKFQKESVKFIRDFWNAYAREFQKRKLGGELPVLRNRTQKWMGIYLVSRTDGRSGSYFKDFPAWEKRIRHLGVELFREKTSLLR